MNGEGHALVQINVFYRFTWVYLVPQKIDIPRAFERYLRHNRSVPGVEMLRVDAGGSSPVTSFRQFFIGSASAASLHMWVPRLLTE